MTVLPLRTAGLAPAHRVAERRLLPAVAPWAALGAVVLVVVLLSVNLNGAPYFEDDEGTYVAQAQAVLHLGSLAPYTYFYDHPPGGWIQIAAWLALTGDGAWTGGALQDGRVFMVVVQAVSMLLVVAIGRRLTGSLWGGTVAALLFGLSPYAFFFHRRVVLDNLAALWMLAAAAVLLSRRLTLSRVALAAAALGVAVWSKEIAITVMPAFGLLAVRRSPRESRVFAGAVWFLVSCGIVSFYPLMALLKGELFTRGTPLGGTAPHVSLLCSLAWQSSRGADGGLLQPGSGFWSSAVQWAEHDPVLVVGGTLAAVVAVLRLRSDPVASSFGLAVLCFWAFLGRGGITLGLYLVPLVPFLALALVAGAWSLVRGPASPGRSRTVTRIVAPLGAAAALVLAVAGLRAPANAELWTTDPVLGQQQAAAWIQQHLPTGSRIVMDMYLYPALHDAAALQDAPFPDAEYYWKAAEDPAVRRLVFHERWQDVDYVVVTPQLVADTSSQGFPLIRAALDHSASVARFDTGYQVDVRRVSPSIHSSDFTWRPVTGGQATNCMVAGS